MDSVSPVLGEGGCGTERAAAALTVGEKTGSSEISASVDSRRYGQAGDPEAAEADAKAGDSPQDEERVSQGGAISGVFATLPGHSQRSDTCSLQRVSEGELKREESPSPCLPLPLRREEETVCLWHHAFYVILVLLQVSLLLLGSAVRKCAALRSACTSWREVATRKVRVVAHAFLSLFPSSRQIRKGESEEPRRYTPEPGSLQTPETGESVSRISVLHAFVLFRSEELLLLSAAATLSSGSSSQSASLSQTRQLGPADTLLLPCLESAFDCRIRFLTVFDAAGVCCREPSLSRLSALLSRDGWVCLPGLRPLSAQSPRSPRTASLLDSLPSCHPISLPYSSASLYAPSSLHSPLSSSHSLSSSPPHSPSSSPSSLYPSRSAGRQSTREGPVSAAASTAALPGCSRCSSSSRKFSCSSRRDTEEEDGRSLNACMQQEKTVACCTRDEKRNCRDHPWLSPSGCPSCLLSHDNPLSLDLPQSLACFSTKASSASLVSSPPISSTPAMSSISVAPSTSSLVSLSSPSSSCYSFSSPPSSYRSSSSFSASSSPASSSSFPFSVQEAPIPDVSGERVEAGVSAGQAAAGSVPSLASLACGTFHRPVCFRLSRMHGRSLKRGFFEGEKGQEREETRGLLSALNEEELDTQCEEGSEEQSMLVRIMCGCCAHEDLFRRFKVGSNSSVLSPFAAPSTDLPSEAACDGQTQSTAQQKQSQSGASSLPQLTPDLPSRSPSSYLSSTSCESSRDDPNASPSSLASCSSSPPPSVSSCCFVRSCSFSSEQWGEERDRGETRASSRRTDSRESTTSRESTKDSESTRNSESSSFATLEKSDRRSPAQACPAGLALSNQTEESNRRGAGRPELRKEEEEKKKNKNGGEKGSSSEASASTDDRERDQLKHRVRGISCGSAKGKEKAPMPSYRVPSRTVIQQPEVYRHLACGGDVFPPPLCVFLLGPSMTDLVRAFVAATSRRLGLVVRCFFSFKRLPESPEGGFASLHEDRTNAGDRAHAPTTVERFSRLVKSLLGTDVRAAQSISRLLHRPGLLHMQFGRRTDQPGDQDNTSARGRPPDNSHGPDVCTLRHRRAVATEEVRSRGAISLEPKGGTTLGLARGFPPRPLSTRDCSSSLLSPLPVVSVSQLANLLLHALARRLVSLLAPYDYLPPFGLCGVPPFALADAELCWPRQRGIWSQGQSFEQRREETNGYLGPLYSTVVSLCSSAVSLFFAGVSFISSVSFFPFFSREGRGQDFLHDKQPLDLLSLFRRRNSLREFSHSRSWKLNVESGEGNDEKRATKRQTQRQRTRQTQTVFKSERKVAQDLRECLRDFQFRELRFGR